MKVFLILIIFLCVKSGFSVSNKQNEFLFRFTGIHCSSSNKTYINVWWNIKPYSRTVSVINTGGTLLISIYKVYMDNALDYKYGTIYREVLKIKNVELCSIFNGTTTNFAVNAFMNTIKDSLPEYRPCPFDKKFEMYNITSNPANVPSFFPSGIYRSRTRFYDDTDSNIYSLTVNTICNSPIKTSF